MMSYKGSDTTYVSSRSLESWTGSGLSDLKLPPSGGSLELLLLCMMLLGSVLQCALSPLSEMN